MNKQTWGLHIVGYSSPSPAQQAKFAALPPSTVAWWKMEQAEREREEQAKTDKVRKDYRDSLTVIANAPTL